MTTGSAAAPTTSTAVPDWNTIDEEILCPLCHYNLRGLTEPRCPECGYTSTWPEIFDPTRRLHPYLFEHHPERNVKSFWQTALGGLRPRRFWSRLHPAQPSVLPRLIGYWAATTAICIAALAGAWLGLAVDVARSTITTPANRAAVAASLRNPRTVREKGLALRAVGQYGSIQAYIDTVHPAALTPRVVWAVLQPNLALGILMGQILVILAWPWMTFATLMIFQSSMQRHHVRPIHVLRCVLYGFDVVLWIGLALAVTSMAGATLLGAGRGAGLLINHAISASVAATMVLFTYRLRVAHRHYLRVRHPMAIVLASQIIVALLVLILG